MPTAKDPRLTIRLTPGLDLALKATAKARGVSPATLARDAIERAVQPNGAGPGDSTGGGDRLAGDEAERPRSSPPAGRPSPTPEGLPTAHQLAAKARVPVAVAQSMIGRSDGSLERLEEIAGVRLG